MIKKLFFPIFCALLLASCGGKDFFSSDAVQNGQSGSITRFAVLGKYMYTLNLNEVKTYDLTDKNKPVLVHSLATDYGLETITIYDNTIYLGSTTALYILDITNPAAPALLAKSDRSEMNLQGCDPVVVKGNYAYSTVKIIANVCGNISAQSALLVYDITNKSAPRVINQIRLSMPNGLGIKDNYLIVCDEGLDQLLVFDINMITKNGIPNSILPPTSFTVSIKDPVDLIVRGNQMIVSCKTEFQIFDVSNIANIRKVGQILK
jgi:hypothetical protein